MLTHKHSVLLPPVNSRQSRQSTNIQGYPTASDSLPFPFEEFIAIHCSTSVLWLVSPSLCDGNYVPVFLLQHGFPFLLFVVHAVCISVDALQLCIYTICVCRYIYLQSCFLFRERSSNPCMAICCASVVSCTSKTLVSLLPHGSPSSTSTEATDWLCCCVSYPSLVRNSQRGKRWWTPLSAALGRPIRAT